MYEPLFRGLLFPLYEGLLRRRRTLAHLREYRLKRIGLPRRHAAAATTTWPTICKALCWRSKRR